MPAVSCPLRSGLTNEVRPGGPGTALGPGLGGAGLGAAGVSDRLSPVCGAASAWPGAGSAGFSCSDLRAVGPGFGAGRAPSPVGAEGFGLLLVFLAGFCFPAGGDEA